MLGAYDQNRLICVVLCGLIFANVLGAAASTPVEFGFRGFTFPKGTGGSSQPTGEKPESKMWWKPSTWNQARRRSLLSGVVHDLLHSDRRLLWPEIQDARH